MSGRIVGLVIADSVLFNRTGMIGRWAEGINTSFVAHAIAEAPIGSDSGRVNKSRANAAEPVGSLKAGISGDVNRVGPKQLQVVVSSSASYSLYVLRGTGMIFSTASRVPKGEPGAGQFRALESGEGLYIPANPGWGKALIKQRVRGQSANNFFERAFAATARRHSSLRGYSMVGSV